MLDRLISGAGAVTDAADRSVRLHRERLAPGVRGDPTRLDPRRRACCSSWPPCSCWPASRPPTRRVPVRSRARRRRRRRGRCRTGPTRRSAGRSTPIYVETYVDDNGNDIAGSGRDRRSPGIYWLVDPADRTGVTVRSTRPPTEVLTWDGRGIVAHRPRLPDRGLPGLPRRAGPERDHARAGRAHRHDRPGRPGRSPPIDAQRVRSRPTGQPVAVSGSRLGEYLGVCTTRPEPRRAVRRRPRRSATRSSSSTRRASSGVPGARARPARVRGGDDDRAAASRGADRRPCPVGRRSRLRRRSTCGSRTATSSTSRPGAGERAAGVRAGRRARRASPVAIVIGLAGGYLVYRRSAGRCRRPRPRWRPGERIPLRITGIVLTPTGRLHVREVPGELVRFVARSPGHARDRTRSSPSALSEPAEPRRLRRWPRPS